MFGTFVRSVWHVRNVRNVRHVRPRPGTVFGANTDGALPVGTPTLGCPLKYFVLELMRCKITVIDIKCQRHLVVYNMKTAATNMVLNHPDITTHTCLHAHTSAHTCICAHTHTHSDEQIHAQPHTQSNIR